MSLRLNLTKQSKTYLSNLHHHIHELLSQLKLSAPKPKISFSQSKSQSKSQNRFISPKIRKSIKKLTIRYSLSSPQVLIILYTKNPSTTTTNLLIKLYYIILTIKAFAHNTLPVSITIYLTPHRKLLPYPPSKPLGPNEVNSGSTLTQTNSPIPQNGKVLVWRKEELLRVTIHELLHAIRSDFALYITPYLDNQALKHFNILPDNNININEVYNEFNACLLTTVISSKTPTILFTNLEHERLYSIKLATKIIQYQNVLNNLPPHTDPEWIFKPHKPSSSSSSSSSPSSSSSSSSSSTFSPVFKQETNVLSYYILKSALLFNLNETLNYIQHIPTYPIFPPNNQEKLTHFFKLILNLVTKFRPILTKLVLTIKYPPKPADRSLKMVNL